MYTSIPSRMMYLIHKKVNQVLAPNTRFRNLYILRRRPSIKSRQTARNPLTLCSSTRSVVGFPVVGYRAYPEPRTFCPSIYGCCERVSLSLGYADHASLDATNAGSTGSNGGGGTYLFSPLDLAASLLFPDRSMSLETRRSAMDIRRKGVCDEPE